MEAATPHPPQKERSNSGQPDPTKEGHAQRNIHIIDTFRVNGLMSFLNCEIFMDSMAVIWIEPGQTLNIDSCTVQAACNYMWDGIYVADSTATLNVSGGTVIRDGVHAISSRQGGFFVLENSEMRANWIGLTLEEFQGVHSGIVRGTRFTARAGDMLPPHNIWAGEAGIFVDEVGEWNCGAVGASWRNVFDSLGVGVLAHRSNVSVINGKFSNMILKPNVKGLAGYGLYSSGISARGEYGVSPSQTWEVKVGGSIAESCLFEDINMGMRVRDNIDLDARKNSFKNVQHTGIELRFCHDNTILVKENKFFNYIFGMYMVMNNGSQVTAEGNDFISGASYQGVGIVVEDWNLFGVATPGGSSYKIVGNTVDMFAPGIGISAAEGVEVLDNNVFMRGPGTYGPFTTGISINGSDSAVVSGNYVRNFGGLNDSLIGIRVSLTNNARICNNDIWDFPNDLGFFGPCNDSRVYQNKFYGGLRGIVLEWNGVIGPQGSFGNPSGNKWMGTWNCGGAVFKTYVGQNTFPQNDPIFVRNTTDENGGLPSICSGGFPQISFITTNGTGAYVCPENTTGGGKGDDNLASLEEIVDASRTYTILENESKYLDGQYVLARFDSDSILCQSDASFVVCHDSLETSSHGLILKAEKALVFGQDYLIPDYFQFTPSTQLESNYKATYLALSNWLAVDTISSADSTVLDGIARQCPLVGGKGVYLARSMMGAIFPGLIYSDSECGNYSSKTKEPEGGAVQDAGWVRFMPNPTQFKLRIESSLQGSKVEAYSVNGQMITSFSMPDYTIEIDVSKWSRGMYFFKWLLPNGSSGSSRIVLE